MVTLSVGDPKGPIIAKVSEVKKWLGGTGLNRNRIGLLWETRGSGRDRLIRLKCNLELAEYAAGRYAQSVKSRGKNSSISFYFFRVRNMCFYGVNTKAI